MSAAESGKSNRVSSTRTIEELAGQVLIAGFHGHTLPESLSNQLSEGQLGGLILFKRNIGETDGQQDLHAVHRLLCDALDAARLATDTAPPLLCVDQEGGRVQRLKAPVLQLPSMRRLAALGDPSLCQEAARHLGRQLKALGFNCDFAPVLDVDTNPANPVIGDRAFGPTPEEVIRYALAFAEGLGEAGIAGCGKHFPGHGDTDLDSHLALPSLPHGLERLGAVELPPFRAANGRVPAIMTAHVIFQALDPEVPATLSHAVITGLLRESLGYDGVIVSDDLEMKAISDHIGIAEGAVRAIAAGCDAVLICSDERALGEAHRALCTRAEADTAFRARLLEAATRFESMRRAHPPAPAEAGALDAALRSDEMDAFAARLDQRLADC